MTKLLRKDIYLFVFSIIIYPSGLSSFVGGYEITPANTQILQIEERVDHPIYNDGKDKIISQREEEESCSKDCWNQVGSTIEGKANGSALGYAVSLSLDGSTIAVSQGNYCQVRVFSNSAGNWNQLGKPIILDSQYYSTANSVLSNDGTIVAVSYSAYNSLRGIVKVFEWMGDKWSQKGLDLYGLRKGDRFGHSIDLSGDGNILVVSALAEIFKNRGTVTTFSWSNDEGAWEKVGQTIYGKEEGGLFYNLKLSANGNRLTIGSTRYSYVAVYRWNSALSKWRKMSNNIIGPGTPYESRFGTTLAISSNGMVLAIGAYGDGYNRNGITRVYRWERKERSWNLRGEIEGWSSSMNSSLHLAISANGSIIAIGSHCTCPDGVRVYQWSWWKNTYIRKGTNEFPLQIGSGAVSLTGDGNGLAIGFRTDQSAGKNRGKVEVYEWQEGK